MSERADFKTRFSSTNQPVNTGRKRGSRDKLASDFVAALAADFEEHGEQAIKDARAKNPNDYIKTVASLLPKEMVVRKPEDQLSDEEVEAAYAELGARIAARKALDSEKVH